MVNITERCNALASQYTALFEEMNNTKCPVIPPYSTGGNLHSCAAAGGAYTVPLHVVAIFVILIASIIGTVLPLLGKYVPALRMHPFAIILGKCLSSGVVMSVAMVHMLNHGILGFLKDCVPSVLQESFDAYSLLLAMVSAMLMHMLDIQMDSLLEGWVKRDIDSTSPTEYEHAGPAVEEGGTRLPGTVTTTTTSTTTSTTSTDINNTNDNINNNTNHNYNHNHNDSAAAVTGGHNHGGLATARLNSLRRMASAIFMEFGLALHSVFLGLSVGIANDTETRALLVALSFHQIFEGLALGARLADATMHLSIEILLVLIYALSVPLGTVIGVVVVNGTQISMTGSTFMTLQAVTDSICGGILLYLGFTLLLNDFPEDLRAFAGPTAAHRVWKVCAMYIALWLGAGIMTILGKWA